MRNPEIFRMPDWIEITDFRLLTHPCYGKSLRFHSNIDAELKSLQWEADIHNNPLMQHLMSENLFDAFIRSMSSSQHRYSLGCKSVLLLTLFVSFKKDQVNNPYIVKLSIIQEEVALNVSC